MTFFNQVMHDPATLQAIDRGQTYFHPDGIVFNDIFHDTDMLKKYAEDEYRSWIEIMKVNPDRQDMLRKADLYVKMAENDVLVRTHYQDIAMSYILLAAIPIVDIRTTINTYVDIGLRIRDLVRVHQQNYKADLEE